MELVEAVQNNKERQEEHLDIINQAKIEKKVPLEW